jgi:O-antigen ligase
MTYPLVNAVNVSATPSGVPKMRLTVPRLIVNAIAVVYVLSVYLLVTVDMFSRVSIVMAALLMAAVFAYGLSVGRLAASRLMVFPVLFCALNVLSLLWAPNIAVAFDSAGQTCSAVLGGMAIWLALDNGLSWKTFVWATVLGAMVLTISSGGEVAESGIGGRAAGLTQNANGLSMYLFFTAFIIWFAPVKLPKWLHLLAWAFAAYAVLFTGSRKSLAMLVAAVLLATIRYAPKLRYLKTWLVLVFGVCPIVVVLSIVIMNTRKLDVAESIESTQSVSRLMSLLGGQHNVRYEMADDAIALWRNSPLIGNGAGQFSALSVYGAFSHNNYTELLANFGLVGLFLYYILHLALIARVVPGAVRGHPEHQAALLLLLLIFVLDMGMVPFSNKECWILLAAIANLATRNRVHSTTQMPRPASCVLSR